MTYSDFLKTQSCIVTNDTATDYMAIDPAHIRKGANGGLNKKPSDQFIIPLRHDLHQLQHSMGERSFWLSVFNNEIDGVYYGEQVMFEALLALSEKQYKVWKNG